ncbi:MAG: hypothetical protein ACRDPQ_03525 [Nocardioidaceae bacterium]
MGPTEKATRAALRSLGASLSSSPLARTAVQLARHLDADPGDRSLVMLSRELRLVMAQLGEGRPKGGDADDVEAFLARIAASDGGNTPH